MFYWRAVKETHTNQPSFVFSAVLLTNWLIHDSNNQRLGGGAVHRVWLKRVDWRGLEGPVLVLRRNIRTHVKRQHEALQKNETPNHPLSRPTFLGIGRQSHSSQQLRPFCCDREG